MTNPPDATRPNARPWLRPLVIVGLLGLLATAVALGIGSGQQRAQAIPGDTPKVKESSGAKDPKPEDDQPAPEFPEKMDWLNTAGPVTMKDLKGKIVLLDFWTLCCINCIHTLPDLAKLEKKYANEIVVIGVHSAKFDSEKETKNIRKAVLRYEIAHPVVNDGDHKIWDKYGVSSWPTLVVVDTEGKVVGATSGEGNYETLDRVIAKLIEDGKKKKTLDDKPIRFDLVRFREKGDTPLFFPGKVFADEKSKRLFIADSTHHRVVVTDLDGKKLDIIGTGTPGFKDGKFAEAQFDDPQGMALDGDLLYIADRKNHSIRAANLKTGEVKIFAGTGLQDPRSRNTDTPADPLKTGLNSPWDVLLVGRTLFIAMAGHHQIWAYDLKDHKIQVFAGDGGENIKDGPLYASRFAQPSGLTSDGKFLYVADSEVSAVRKLSVDGNGRVETLIGEGLFEFGDKDGTGKDVRIQHALGVVAHDGKILIADTYNDKLKSLDPKTTACKTLLGGNEPGTKEPLFSEPAGMSIAAGKLYVADTNAHRIRVVDLKTLKVSTLALTGVEPPPPQKEWQPKPALKKDDKNPEPKGEKPVALPKGVEKVEATFEPAEAKPGQAVTFRLTVTLVNGYHTYPLTQADQLAEGMTNKISFPETGPVIFVGEATDPPDALTKPEPLLGIKSLRYYSDKVVYERKAVVSPKAPPGGVAVPISKFVLSVCDKDSCFPPKSLALQASLKIADGPAVAVDAKYAAEVERALKGK